MPGRQYNSNQYRYGFNGKENDNEVKGTGNQQDYGLRIYDPRLGKFLSTDPLSKKYPFYSPYQFAGNTPIFASDLDGGEIDPRIYMRREHPVLMGITEGVTESLTNTWSFITHGAWQAETWKQTGLVLEEAILGSSPFNNANTPRLDAAVKSIDDNIINGNAYTRSKALSQIATDIATAYASSKGIAGLSKVAKIGVRTNLANQFYQKAGFNTEKAAQHMEGINFEQAVKTTTLKKGTTVQQWVGENGVGDYFTTLENGANQNLGLNDYANRTLKQFTLTEDVKVLQSTAGDYKGAQGGGTQFFSTELKDKIAPAAATSGGN